MIIHSSFILRQLYRSKKQIVVFILCVGLSIASLTAFSGFSQGVGRAFFKDSKRLLAGDIIIRSRREISKKIDDLIKSLQKKGEVQLSRYYEFYSMARLPEGGSSMLCQLKVVDKNYPLYGKVTLLSGRSFKDTLRPGRIIVEQALLDRLHAKVGDRLKIGYTTLTIADVLLSEPDRIINFFSFGPRIFVSIHDLKALGLLKTGSRISYVDLLKVHDESRIDSITAELKNVSDGSHERISNYKTARSRIKRFLDNFVFFLNLVGIFILIMAGAGIQASVTALLKEEQPTIAIMKSVGATNRFTLLNYMLLLFVSGFLGTILGIVAGFFLQYGLIVLMTNFLPHGMKIPFAWSTILESVVLGFSVVALFSFIPLYRMKEIRPILILRKVEFRSLKKWPLYLSSTLFALFILSVVFRHMRDLKFGLFFTLGIIILVFIAYVISSVLLYLLRKANFSSLMVRQAVKGLFRKGNATKPVIITLTTSLCVIFSIYLIERSLVSNFVESYPQNAPNLFFIDIQPSQTKAFKKVLGKNIRLYPVIRARIVSVNNEKINPKKERERRGDNLGRTFNLTYRDYLLKDEKIIEGKSLFRKDWKGAQVSVMDTVAKMHHMKIGDVITFSIEGVDMGARISSIRTRVNESLSPFFYFVFQDKVLRNAPQTIFSAARVRKDEKDKLRNRIANEFPNISVIDVSETIRLFSNLVDKLAGIIRGFSALSILGGLLIMISSFFATRAERIMESVYFKILGARNIFVFKVFTLENIIIGLVSGLQALILSHIFAWWVSVHYLNIKYDILFIPSVLLLLFTVLLIVITGAFSMRSILLKKPAVYLRERTDD